MTTDHLLGVMDLLWFHQIILFSEPISFLKPEPISEILPNPPSNLSPTLLLEEEISPDKSPIPSQDEEEPNYKRKRPTRLSLVSSKTRSLSSSPSLHKLAKHLRNNSAPSRLRKTMSCKSLWELEYEEVKGFMDLGFTFKKEQLNPRMMSMIPGLQRIGEYCDDEQEEAAEELEEKKISTVIRPYLSEAWLIKTPDSPLLNLRMPPVSAAAEMKKHLRFWARTVASVIQLEY